MQRMTQETTPDVRLKEAREGAGYRSAAAFARAFELSEATYRSHENGTRPLTIPASKQYAPCLGVTWQWLLFGETDASVNQGMPALPPKRVPMPVGMAGVDELDVKAGAGGGGSIDHEMLVEGDLLRDHLPAHRTWTMPTDVIRQITSSPTEAIKIITIVGNSMTPELLPGSKAMVDTADRTPSPPGIFAVWDGMAIVAKIIEYIPFSEPPRVRIKSKNPDYDPYERTLDEAYIQGRIVGRWQWT